MSRSFVTIVVEIKARMLSLKQSSLQGSLFLSPFLNRLFVSLIVITVFAVGKYKAQGRNWLVMINSSRFSQELCQSNFGLFLKKGVFRRLQSLGLRAEMAAVVTSIGSVAVRANLGGGPNGRTWPWPSPNLPHGRRSIGARYKLFPTDIFPSPLRRAAATERTDDDVAATAAARPARDRTLSIQTPRRRQPRKRGRESRTKRERERKIDSHYRLLLAFHSLARRSELLPSWLLDYTITKYLYD